MVDGVSEEPATGAPPPPTARIRHDGTWQALVPVHMKFLALTLVTLGVYQFWARTFARRLLWQRTRLLDDPFVYLGRPLELLLGFAVALVLIFGPILTLNLYLVLHAKPEADAPMTLVAVALSAAQAVAIPYLIFVGTYTAHRYRLSRTAWRGIRGGQTGSAWTYGLRGLLGAFLTGITFGWHYPWQRARLARIRIGNSWFGSQRFVCDVRGGDLAGAFAILWFGALTAFVVLPLIGAGIAFLVVGLEGMPTEIQSNQLAWLANVAPLVLIYAPVGFFLLIYRALELREVARHTRFARGAVRFAMTHTVWQYVRYALGNLLIALLTLGTGWIYLRRRQLVFWSRFLVITGDMDFAALRQTALGGPRTGEGLAELFDIGFDVGF